MSFILGAILGLIVGAGLIYLWLQKTISQQQQELKKSHRTVEDLSKSHESRLRDATQQLQSDYQRQLAQQTDALKQQYEDRLQAAEQVSSKPRTAVETPDPEPTAPTPSPTPEPQDSAPTPSPTPEPQDSPVAESPVSQPPEPALPSVDPVPVTPDIPVIPIQVVVEDVEQKISAWAIPGAVSGIPQTLQFANHPDPQVRVAVASTIEAIASSHRVSREVQQAIAPLGKLSRDPEPMVRHAALVALARIPSEQVLPFLERALRDPDGRIVKVASEAIAKYKFYATSASAKTAKSRRHVRR